MVDALHYYSDKIAVQSFRVLLITTIIFPTGSIYGLNYKAALIGVLLVVGLNHLFNAKKEVIASSIILMISLISGVVGIVKGVSPLAFSSQLMAIGSVLVIFSIGSYYANTEMYGLVKFADDIIKYSAIYSLIKLIIVIGVLIQAFSIFEIQAILFHIFGYNFITLDAGYFFRIHLPNDYFLPLAIILFLLRKMKGDWNSRIIIALIIVGAVISYSRLIYVFMLIIFLVKFAMYLKKSKKNIFDHLTNILVILVAVGALFFANEFFVMRFSGEYADDSDALRVTMKNGLLNLYQENLFFGSGLGSNIPGLIRLENNPWYYELQWLSLLAQFGSLLFPFILLIAIYPILFVVTQKISVQKLLVLIGYILWLGANYFNGFMLTSAGGFIFLGFYLLLTTSRSGFKIYTATKNNS
ncbi:MAG: hypothetical protein FDX21_03790 [Chlorobium sp.]|nr:MAG: hypothetical protein FDX21_03790 [Chlorobium sp.]